MNSNRKDSYSSFRISISFRSLNFQFSLDLVISISTICVLMQYKLVSNSRWKFTWNKFPVYFMYQTFWIKFKRGYERSLWKVNHFHIWKKKPEIHQITHTHTNIETYKSSIVKIVLKDKKIPYFGHTMCPDHNYK